MSYSTCLTYKCTTFIADSIRVQLHFEIAIYGVQQYSRNAHRTLVCTVRAFFQLTEILLHEVQFIVAAILLQNYGEWTAASVPCVTDEYKYLAEAADLSEEASSMYYIL